MRINNTGSILLYVLFLSSFLILFFASFNREIGSILSRTQNSLDRLEESFFIDDALISLKNNPKTSFAIGGDTNLSLVSLDYNGTTFSGVLSLGDTHEYWVTSTGGDTSLSLVTSAPLVYRIANFSSGSEAGAVVFSSGIITGGTTIIPLAPSGIHILTLESLAGYIEYGLTKNKSVIIPSSGFYRLERSIGSYIHDEGTFEVRNFIQKSYPGIDYPSLGMYLKY